MEANDYQIGGKHYVGKYQHWDFVTDVQMPYLLGCATKYLARWFKKNGLQDLQKAQHYVTKSIERGIDFSKCRWHGESDSKMHLFLESSELNVRGDATGEAFAAVCRGELSKAERLISELYASEAKRLQEEQQ